MEPKTVAELVHEARHGSAEARDELVRRHQREITILAAARVNDATEAEDLAQEAFTRAFRNLDLLVDARRFGAWLPRHIQEVFEEQMTPAAKTRFLHVANGTCTTRLIQAAGIPGALSIWADPLHDGPVPGGLTDEELLDVRLRYHTGPADTTFAAWGGSDPSLDAMNDMRQWRATIERRIISNRTAPSRTGERRRDCSVGSIPAHA